jgi:hypothetical protein
MWYKTVNAKTLPGTGVALDHFLAVLAPPVAVVQEVNVARGLQDDLGLLHHPLPSCRAVPAPAGQNKLSRFTFCLISSRRTGNNNVLEDSGTPNSHDTALVAVVVLMENILVVVVALAVQGLLGNNAGAGWDIAVVAALRRARVVVAALVGDLGDEAVEGALDELLDGAPLARALVVAPRRLGALELLLPVLAPAVPVLGRLLDHRRRHDVRLLLVVRSRGEEGEVGRQQGGRRRHHRRSRRPLRLRRRVCLLEIRRQVGLRAVAERRCGGVRGGMLVGRRVVRLHEWKQDRWL